MSSRRFPGKVLAPFRGRPILGHVVDAVGRALAGVPVVVLTSDDVSDDPVACYAASLGVSVFRGPLDDVFERFRGCLRRHAGGWIVRVNADSPLLDGRVLQAVTAYAGHPEADLVTTIFPRTFPRGHNAELIRVQTLMGIDGAELTAQDREHVTAFYYRHPDRFRILNVDSGHAGLADIRLTVDTIEDLRRLEMDGVESLRALPYDSLVTVPRC